MFVGRPTGQPANLVVDRAVDRLAPIWPWLEISRPRSRLASTASSKIWTFRRPGDRPKFW